MNSQDIKLEARDALKGNWFKAIIAAFIASFFGATVVNTTSVSFSFDFGTTTPPDDGGDNVAVAFNMFTNSNQDAAAELLMIFLLGILAFSLIYSLVMFTVGSAVSIGLCQFNLDVVDGGRPRVFDLFSRFPQMATAIGVKIITIIRVFIGTILFIIPGIVAMYSYAMANFVLAENPGMTASDALKESKRIMKGHRWKLFCMEFSFIGWMMLGVLTFGVAYFFVLPYYNAAHAAFYRRAKNEADYAY